MANYRAVTTVCEAVIYLLKTSHNPEQFSDSPLDFRVGLPREADPMSSGVSLSLYRIYPNSNPRTPAGRIESDGRRYRTQLPVDLHFFLTAWGKDASLQHTIAGWMMRTMEDNPILPANVLNSVGQDVFKADEAVEIHIAELSNDELFRIWEKMTDMPYHLSIPYAARNVRIESDHLLADIKTVRERKFD